MKRKKSVRPTQTLATRGRKVSIKSHSRRTRGGKRVVVKSYSRHTAGKAKGKKPASSGAEFEKRKNQSPYGEPITKRLHTFQGAVEDALFGAKRYSGDKVTEHKRKLKESMSKPKELSKTEKKLDAFLKKHGYKYTKYV